MEASTDTVDVDFRQVKQLGNDLLVQLDRLRDVAPLYWSDKQKAWIVTGHALVAEGFTGTLPLSSDRKPRFSAFMPDPAERARRISYVLATFGRMLISLDPPEQPRLRRLLMKAFNRQVAEYYRPYARKVIAEALENAKANPELDYIESVARYIPTRVIVKLMGLSDEYIPRVRFWAWATLAGGGGGAVTGEILDQTEKAFLEMRAAFMIEIEKRRKEPGQDFVSSLIAAEFEGDKLSDEEIVATLIMTIVGGHDSGSNTIGLGSLLLSQHPDLWASMRHMDGDEVLNAVMEIQRVIGMSTAQGRVVSEDFEWQGQSLKKGQLVYLMIASANRDPAVFPNPEQVDPTRPQQDNMVFAPGLHQCIGHLLAKMQLSEFFPALVEHFDGFEVLEDKLEWTSMMTFRGLETLRVRMKPRAS